MKIEDLKVELIYNLKYYVHFNYLKILNIRPEMQEIDVIILYDNLTDAFPIYFNILEIEKYIESEKL